MSTRSKSSGMSRRNFLKWVGIASTTSLVAACAPEVVEKTVEVTRMAPPEVITATPGPTQQPLPTSTPAPELVKRGGVLVHAQTTDTTSLDPHTVSLHMNRQTCSMFYNTLAVLDTGMRVQPVLAESWEYSDDYLTLILNLRQGVKWHDGTDFTSADVIYTFDRILDPDVGAVYGGALKPVKSYEPQGDHTVKIKFEEPFAAFLPSQWKILIVPASMANKPSDWMANNAIGTGPWMLEDWQPDTQYEMVKNPNYWKPGLPYMDGVDFQIIPEETSIIAALRTGEVDHAWIADKVNLPLLATNPDITLYQSASTGTIFIDINHHRDVWHDATLRRALSLAMDREAILTAAGGSYGVVSNVIPPSMADYWVPPEELEYCRYDPEAAKALLAEYGKPVTIEMINLPVIKFIDIHAQLLADQWKQVGIDVTVRDQEVNEWIASRVETFDYDISPNGVFPGADPDDLIFNQFHPDGDYFAFDFKPGLYPEMENLVAEARTTVDLEKRIELVKDAIRLNDDLALTLTSYSPIEVDAVRNRIANYYAHPSQHPVAFEQTWIES